MGISELRLKVKICLLGVRPLMTSIKVSNFWPPSKLLSLISGVNFNEKFV